LWGSERRDAGYDVGLIAVLGDLWGGERRDGYDVGLTAVLGDLWGGERRDGYDVGLMANRLPEDL
jgi:hypothetical protein